MVKAELGAATNDVGQLCIHPNINKWSKWKPVRHSSVNPITEAQLEGTGSGLNRVDMYEVEYLKPTGGATSPYRLDDFRNYNHTAVPPVSVEIVRITEMSTGQVFTTPPFILFFNFTYKIEFRFPIGGEIDPLIIHPQTSRTKNTDAGGGYGGLSWVSGTDNAVTRVSADVFSAPSGPTIHSQTLTLLPNGILNPLRVQYCQYNGSETGDYTTVPYAIENSDYISLFTFGYIDITMALNTFYDSLGGYVNSNVQITNNSGRSFAELRARYVYTINGGSQITHIAPISTLNTGVNNVNQTLNNGNPGANSYSVYCYLERLDNITSSWEQLAWTNRTQTVTLPQG
jgi:hypothetical protein